MLRTAQSVDFKAKCFDLFMPHSTVVRMGKIGEAHVAVFYGNLEREIVAIFCFDTKNSFVKRQQLNANDAQVSTIA